MVKEHRTGDDAHLKANLKEAKDREHAMAEQDPPPVIDRNQVADIVSSYVRHHQVAADQLTGLIVEVHRALASLGPAPPVQEPAKPAVPIRRSVRQDYVVCLECGLHARTLRRHLRVRHGLEVAQHRARWSLSPDYPLTAPAYSDRRAVMAKAIGLGRRRSSVRPPSASARRRRPRQRTMD